jgi:hypothetical protein
MGGAAFDCVVAPADFEQLLAPLPGDMRRRIMRDNAESIFATV